MLRADLPSNQTSTLWMLSKSLTDHQGATLLQLSFMKSFPTLAATPLETTSISSTDATTETPMAAFFTLSSAMPLHQDHLHKLLLSHLDQHTTSTRDTPRMNTSPATLETNSLELSRSTSALRRVQSSSERDSSEDQVSVLMMHLLLAMLTGTATSLEKNSKRSSESTDSTHLTTNSHG